MPFEPLISLRQCNVNQGTFVEHHGRELAVFLLNEPHEVFVIDNTCPHAGGNLSGGEVADHVVTCPWHSWPFDLRTGVCVHSPQARVRRYPAEIRGDAVWVDLDSER